MRGPIESIAIEGRLWGSALEDVAMKVHLYQDDADNGVLPVGAKALDVRQSASVKYAWMPLPPYSLAHL